MAADQLTSDQPAKNAHARFVLWLTLAFAAIAMLICALAALSLLQARDALRQRAQVAAENLAAILEQSIEAELVQVDTALQNVGLEIRQRAQDPFADRAHTEAVLAGQLALVPELQSLRVADSRGVVRLGQGAATEVPANIGDSAFFRAARDSQRVELVISEPVQAGAGHQWVMVLARRFEASDGSFAGVIYADLSTDHFQRMFEAVNIGEKGAISLRTTSMRLVSRFSPGQSAGAPIGSSTVSAQLAQAVRASPRKGSFAATTALDQIERINAYRQIGNRPLLVVVGFETSAYFGPWRTHTIQVAGLVAIVLVMLTAAAVYIAGNWRRQRENAKALQEEGHRTRALLLTASDGIHVLDRQGRLVELSDSFAALLGADRQALLGRHASSWDASLAPEAIERWLASFQFGRKLKFETRHRRADGSVIDVEINSAAIRIAGQDLVYCSSRDITERKQLEQQLAESTRRIEDLYDHAPCGYHSLDATGLFVHINATELAWLGYQKDEVVGKKRVTDFFTQEGQAFFAENFPRIKATGRLDGVELSLVCRDGSLRRVSLQATAVFDASGQFSHTRSVLHDITELQRAKDELTSLSREQQAMLDNELIGIAKVRNRVIVWKNLAVDRIFGYRSAELLGQPTRVLHVDEETFAREGEAAYPILQSGGHYRRQLQMLRKDGQRIWIDSNGVMISPDSGESLWMFTDITPIKDSQAHIEHIAFHDPLTGLPNRLLLSDRLQQGLALAERRGCSLAVCYVDLDGFKQVNDALGHEAGDVLLQEIARRLQGCVRANDTVSRLGGDEFVLLMTEVASAAECLAILERVLGQVARPVHTGASTQSQVSASIGVALYPADGRDADVLMRNADAAMYAAKRAGKNHIQRFSDALPA